MRHIFFALIFGLFLSPAAARDRSDLIADTVDSHILPRFAKLAETAHGLSEASKRNCRAESDDLRAAYGTAFDAWVAASHLRFGPAEAQDRAYALAFWPDNRGATPKTLSKLITTEDPIAKSAADYQDISIAARGLYALEFLLYDDRLKAAGDTGYHCQLVQTVAADIASLADQINQEWTTDYASRLKNPDADGTYRSVDEALREIFKALTTGLEFTADARLGRPLGTFDKPRPKRAEARRAGRSSQHVRVSLESLRDLSLRLARGNSALSAKLITAYQRALDQLEKLNDPVFASVSTPQSRLKVESLQQDINRIRDIVRTGLGPDLDVAAGFNSLDGD